MAQTIADQLVSQLVEAGVRRIYGIVGDSLNPVVDAVRRTGGSVKGGIDWIHVRHEEAAAFMASADAQLTGETVQAEHLTVATADFEDLDEDDPFADDLDDPDDDRYAAWDAELPSDLEADEGHGDERDGR